MDKILHLSTLPEGRRNGWKPTRRCPRELSTRCFCSGYCCWDFNPGLFGLLQIADEPPPLREIPPDCGSLTAEVLKAGLQKDPVKRASASDLKAKTDRALKDGKWPGTNVLHFALASKEKGCMVVQLYNISYRFRSRQWDRLYHIYITSKLLWHTKNTIIYLHGPPR